MTQLRIKHNDIGGAMGTVSVTVGAFSGSVNVPSYRAPLPLSGLPRIRGGQFQADTLAVDETGLTGITARQWRIKGGMALGTAATQSLTGLMGQVECVVTCDQGTLTTPSVMVYISMGMASHDADDMAVLALVPHDEATHIAIADGEFENKSTWLNGQVPGWGARVLIPHGINVTYDRRTVGIRFDWMRVDGTLTHSLSVSTDLLVETMIVTRGASHIVGTFSAPIPANVTHSIRISNRDYGTDANAPCNIDLTRDPTLIGRGIVSQGMRSYWGATKTPWLRAANGSTVSAGDTSVTLAAMPVNWRVGDTIAIGGTSVTDATETEYREITAISGANVTWSGGLTYRHDHRNANVTRTDLQPGIANVTRNIKISSEDGSDAPHRRGHTMDMHHHARQDLWNVEHTHMGRTIKDPRDLQIANNTAVRKIDVAGVGGTAGYWDWSSGPTYTTETLTAATNIKSRYAIHSHFLGFGKANRDVVHGCTTRNSAGWGIVHHGCEVEQNSNVVVDYGGAGMVTETGNETGEWVGNFTAGAKAKYDDSLKNGEDSYGNFGVTGVGMFFRGRLIVANDNFNMDAAHGAGFYHRESGNANNITPRIDVDPADMDFGDLFGFSRHYGIKINEPPIIHFNNNESAGCFWSGMSVVKNQGRQQTHWNVNIKGFKAWAWVHEGQHIEYIHQYVLTDTDVVAHTDGAGRGISIGNNAYNIAVVRPKTEGCLADVYFGKNETAPDYSLFNTTTDPRFIVAGKTSIRPSETYNATNGVQYFEAGAQNTTQYMDVEPSYLSEPTLSYPFKQADFDGTTTLTNSATATLTDSIGSVTLPLPNEFGPFVRDSGSLLYGGDADMPQRIRNYGRQQDADEGFWTVNGDPYVIYPGYVADRVTGVATKVWMGIELTSTAGYALNGAYVKPPVAPVVSAADLNVPISSAATINISALASHPDGAPMRLSLSHNRPNRARLEIDGWNVTVTALDTAQVGQTDEAWLWVEDIAGSGRGKQVGGNATRVLLSITFI